MKGKRGHLEKYEPFGGLSAAEIRKIENGCLLNRPKNEKEAIERNVSNIDGKNFDEVVEKGYMKAADTISNFYGKDYKKGELKIGQKIKVKIKDAMVYDLIGVALDN